VQGP
jgi:hypothetical protein